MEENRTIEGQIELFPRDKSREKEMENIMEALLFTLARAVEVRELVQACGCSEKEAKEVMQALMRRYGEAGGGVLIREVDGKYQMYSNPLYFDALVRVVSQPRRPELSEVMLETLAIIASRSPATRVDVEKIRGVKSDHAVNKLIEYGLIEEAGRLNVPGRPILFRPTDEFYRRFGVFNRDSMPEVGEELESRIEQEVQLEVREALRDGKEGQDNDGKDDQDQISL